ncbi:helicase associated domain-containing protein [Streptomyces sp. NPDC056255]|uniref:helicase associated domain-containing protein n=1 Tax=Streptomyces sp. NPDC056255 TaxID=3345764 RepID=UPI0035DE958A
MITREARYYHTTHGRLTPPAPAVVNGRRLGAWLSVRRTRRHQGRLAHPQQIAALDELGIRWWRSQAENPPRALQLTVAGSTTGPTTVRPGQL